MKPERGRPKVENKAMFRSVGVPMEIYDMIKDLAKAEDRTIARQLAVVIKHAHEKHFQA